MSKTPTLPPELTAQLTRMIRRVRLIMLTRGLLAVAAVTVSAVLAIMAIDAAVVLMVPAVRWVFSLGGLALAAGTAWSMLVLPLTRPLTLTRMARVLETRHPDMQERISSAIELAEHGGGAEAERASAELVALLTREAKSDLAGVTPRQEFTVRTVKPFLLSAGVMMLVLTLLFGVWPRQSWLLFLRALIPFREFDTLEACSLEVKPGDVMQLARRPLRFEVTAPERHGLRAEIHFIRPGGKDVVERMTRLSPQGVTNVVFELELPSVDQGFEYRVRYGNGYTRPYSVVVVTEPGVQSTRLTYTYPSYTGLQPTQVVMSAESQPVLAVAGTRLRFESAFDRPCEAALRLNALTLMYPGGAATNAVWLQTLSTNRNGRWSIALRDANRFTNELSWASYTAVPDRPPEVTLDVPEAARLTLPPYDRLVCTGAAADDYGFGAMEWVVRSEKTGELTGPLKATRQGGARAELEAAPDLQALYNQGWRAFKLCFRVADNLPPELGGPQVRESRSIVVMLEMGAKTLREQVREAARREIEQQLRKAAQELHESANRVAEERWSFDKPELSDKAAAKLEAARESAVQAEERMERAAQATEKTPFAEFAKAILDVRDEKVEAAFKKLEQIPLTEADKRKQLGEETERAFREAADKVNDLVNRVLQDESRKQEEKSRLDELAQQEASLAEKAKADKMTKQEMQEWANRQNEAEQKLWQSKQQMEDPAFNQALEKLRAARETMLQADREVTPQADEALRREDYAAKETEKAAALAEKAAEQALEATEKAEAFAEQRAASDAVQEAAEKTRTAAEQAQQAAQKAEQAAEKRQANEAVADAAERRAIAERAAAAAKEAEQAAQEAAQSAEQSQQAATARQENRQQQAQEAEKKAEAQADQAKQDAQQANAEAVEAARQAEDQGLEQAAEAGQLASEAASFAQRAAELSHEAAQKSEASAAMPEEQKQAALKEAQGLSEQSRDVAAEAKEKAQQAAQRAKEQLEQLAREAQAAAAKQAPSEAVTAQAQEASQQAQQAASQAQEAVKQAQEAVKQAQDATPLDQALAQQVAEAASMAEQAGELANQSGAHTQEAEAQEMGEAQERAATQQAMQEAQAAAQLAAEAAAMAQRAAQQAAAEAEALKQAASQAAQQASQDAQAAAHKAEQANKIARGMEPLQEAAAQSSQSARLTGEAAELAQQALQTAQQKTEASDAKAVGQARFGQTKAQQALELARKAKAEAEARAAAEARQLAAAEKARELAEAMAQMAAEETRREDEAWAQVQGRLGGKTRRAGDGGSGGFSASPRVPLNQDWIRFRGEMNSEAYEEMLKKTPAEYRDLVKQYFEALSGEGQSERK